MPIRNLPGSPDFNEIPGQPLTVDVTPSATKMSSEPTAGPHGAQAPKPTSVRAISPTGVPVAPYNRNGGVTPNTYPYKPEQTEWAVESGTHA
jgi:hypothetical protein